MPIVELEYEKQFFELVKHKKCVVDFYADWCGPCNKLLSNMDKVLEAHPDAQILKVHVNEFDQITDTFKVTSIPHLVFFKKGKLQKDVLKSSDYKELNKMIGYVFNNIDDNESNSENSAKCE
jgi:thioredoxin 1